MQLAVQLFSKKFCTHNKLYFRWKKCLNYIFFEMSSGERLIMWPKRIDIFIHASMRKCFNGPTPPFKMSYYKREFSVFFKENYRWERIYPYISRWYKSTLKCTGDVLVINMAAYKSYQSKHWEYIHFPDNIARFGDTPLIYNSKISKII